MSLLPLEGIRVVDFCSNIAGPFGSMVLAQLGADVIKVEPPAGDDSRYYAGAVDGVSAVHRYVGAGKRGVVVDLKAPSGVEVALAIIERSDVVLQSMRPGVADRIGIGEAVARERNPDVLYYDVNAFGTGPVGRDRPGYDPLVQAFSGIMEMTGHEDTPPTRCAPSVVDLGTGQWVALTVLAALMARGRGRPVATLETALIDTAFSLVAYQATGAKVTGHRPPRAGSGNPIAAPYQCFECSDGWILVAAPSQRLWERTAKALGLGELIEDPRFLTTTDRTRHRHALEDALTEATRHSTTQQCIDRLGEAGVPAGPVQGLEEAVESEVAQERGTFLPSDDVPLVRLPWLADGEPAVWRSTAPRLGEHTREVLADLGFTADRIEALLADGSVVTDAPPSPHRTEHQPPPAPDQHARETP